MTPNDLLIETLRGFLVGNSFVACNEKTLTFVTSRGDVVSIGASATFAGKRKTATLTGLANMMSLTSVEDVRLAIGSVSPTPDSECYVLLQVLVKFSVARPSAWLTLARSGMYTENELDNALDSEDGGSESLPWPHAVTIIPGELILSRAKIDAANG